MAHKRKVSLAEELSLYEANKSEWLKSHSGEFVLINDRAPAGFYPTYERAFEVGLEKFGIKAEFLIKQVLEQEPVFVIY
jgi:hypothetical protein